MKTSAVVGALALLLAGCSGGGSTKTPFWPGCPGGPAIADASARLISPAAGATGVSPTIGSITVGYSQPGPIDWGLALTPTDGSPGVAASIPSQAQIDQSPGIVTLTIPALQSGKTYTVSGQTINMAHVPCYTPITANNGS